MKILNLKSKILNQKRGFVFLEILVSVALISVVFITLLGIGALALNTSFDIQKRTQVDSLVKEEIEAVRAFMDSTATTWGTNGLGSVNTGSGSPYYLVLDSSTPPKWTLQAGTETIGVFTRKVIFDKVSRNPTTKEIESTYNAANDDPDTRKVTVNVVWKGTTYQVVTYFTNWQK